MRDLHRGSCHCGALAYTFETEVAPEHWVVRSCQCSFCRSHGARTTTDPEGLARFEIADPDALIRYRFGLSTADFLVCGRCGIYLGAVMSSDAGTFTTLNTNCMQEVEVGLATASPVHYDEENAKDRNRRRERRWTPVAGGFRATPQPSE